MGLFGSRKKDETPAAPATPPAPETAAQAAQAAPQEPSAAELAAAAAGSNVEGAREALQHAAPQAPAAVEPLNAERHGHLRIDPARRSLSSALTAHLAPIGVSEIAQAAASYPIILVGEPRRPHAVMGIERGVNAFIRPDGRIEAIWYLPAIFRRQPFVFAETADQTQKVLCVDTNSPSLVAEGGVPLFENGQPTSVVNSALEALKAAHVDYQRTDLWMQTLTRLDLIESRSIPLSQPQSPEEKAPTLDFITASSAKLKDLPAEELTNLQRTSTLLAIHAMEISQVNWRRVFERAAARRAQAQAA